MDIAGSRIGCRVVIGIYGYLVQFFVIEVDGVEVAPICRYGQPSQAYFPDERVSAIIMAGLCLIASYASIGVGSHLIRSRIWNSGKTHSSTPHDPSSPYVAQVPSVCCMPFEKNGTV